MLPPETVYHALSKQERQVLWLVANDLPNRLIADDLCVSPHTVKNHKTNLIKKIDLTGTTALHHWAIAFTQEPYFVEHFEGPRGKRKSESGGGVMC